MNADEFDRELEDALRARAAAVAPPEFTREVIRRVAGEGSHPLPIPRWLTVLSGFCDPVVAGVMLLILGATLAFDLGGLLIWGEKVSQRRPRFSLRRRRCLSLECIYRPAYPKIRPARRSARPTSGRNPRTAGK